jgi:hypothetical protein
MDNSLAFNAYVIRAHFKRKGNIDGSLSAQVNKQANKHLLFAEPTDEG